MFPLTLMSLIARPASELRSVLLPQPLGKCQTLDVKVSKETMTSEAGLGNIRPAADV